MYESDDEYSFVVLSRVNSFKKVRSKLFPFFAFSSFNCCLAVGKPKNIE